MQAHRFPVARGALGGVLGTAAAVNVQGEAQKKLDVIANEIFLRTSEWGGHLAGMASEEMDAPYADPAAVSARKLPAGVRSARRLVQHRRQRLGRQHLLGAARAGGRDRARVAADFLQPGARAGLRRLRIYGPTTMLVLTVGRGVHGFTLDREIGEFILTHPDMRIPSDTQRVRDQRVERSASGSRRSSATSTSAWPARAGRAARTSTCAGSRRWWPRCTAS